MRAPLLAACVMLLATASFWVQPVCHLSVLLGVTESVPCCCQPAESSSLAEFGPSQINQLPACCRPDAAAVGGSQGTDACVGLGRECHCAATPLVLYKPPQVESLQQPQQPLGGFSHLPDNLFAAASTVTESAALLPRTLSARGINAPLLL